MTDPLQAVKQPPEEQTKDWPETLKLVQTLELGTLVAIEALWERLGMGKALREVAQQSGCHVPYERALLAMTANRLCEPSSKLGVWDRWLEKVYLPSCQELKLEPVHHRLSRRIEAHVKICVMTLLIERFAELACEQPWSRIRTVLSRFQATEVYTSSHLFFRRNEPSSALMNLMKKLAIPLPDSILSISPLDDATPNP